LVLLPFGSFMGKHHHHPDEGHGAGNPSGSARGHLHHNWFFYVSGLFILLALLAFIFSVNLAWRPSAGPPAQTPSIGVTK
jgi:hypothetical protein